MKWLFLLVGASLFYLWLKGKKQVKLNAERDFKSKAKQAKISEPEVIVQCQYCQLHLPQSEAIKREDRFYCSNEHVDLLDQQGWLGSAHWRFSPNQDKRPEGLIPDLAVIHHISLPPGGFKNQTCTHFVIDFFQNKLDPTLYPYFSEIADQKVSSHFLISRKGELFQFVSTQNKAWHAGLSSFLGREGCNDFSIGIELEGDGEHSFEKIQYQALMHLSQSLWAAYPTIQFAGHSDISPNRKADPGVQFDWRTFQEKCGVSLEKFPYGLSSR